MPSFSRSMGCENALDCRKEKAPATKKDMARATGICAVIAQLIVGKMMASMRVVEGAIIDTADSPPFCSDENHY